MNAFAPEQSFNRHSVEMMLENARRTHRPALASRWEQTIKHTPITPIHRVKA